MKKGTGAKNDKKNPAQNTNSKTTGKGKPSGEKAANAAKDKAKAELLKKQKAEEEERKRQEEMKKKKVEGDYKKLKDYLNQSGLNLAFNIIFAELITKQIDPSNFFPYTAMRLKELGKEVEGLQDKVEIKVEEKEEEGEEQKEGEEEEEAEGNEDNVFMTAAGGKKK